MRLVLASENKQLETKVHDPNNFHAANNKKANEGTVDGSDIPNKLYRIFTNILTGSKETFEKIEQSFMEILETKAGGHFAHPEKNPFEVEPWLKNRLHNNFRHALDQTKKYLNGFLTKVKFRAQDLEDKNFNQGPENILRKLWSGNLSNSHLDLHKDPGQYLFQIDKRTDAPGFVNKLLDTDLDHFQEQQNYFQFAGEQSFGSKILGLLDSEKSVRYDVFYATPPGKGNSNTKHWLQINETKFIPDENSEQGRLQMTGYAFLEDTEVYKDFEEQGLIAKLKTDK